METTVSKKKQKKTSASLDEIASAAAEMGLACQILFDDSGEIEAVLIGEADVVNGMEFDTLFKSKAVH